MVDMEVSGELEDKMKSDIGFRLLISAEPGKDNEDKIRRLCNSRFTGIIGENLQMTKEGSVRLESFDVKSGEGDVLKYEVEYTVAYSSNRMERRKLMSASRVGNITSVLEDGEPFNRYKNYFHSRTYVENDDKDFINSIIVYVKCF